MEVEVNEYEDIWFSKNDVNKRWPNKDIRVALDWKGRNVGLYKDLSAELPYPSFKYDGSRMSVLKDKHTVLRAMEILKRHGYDTTELKSYSNGITQTSERDAYSISVDGNSVMVGVPKNDLDIRYKIKSLPNRKWDGLSKTWVIPLSDASKLISILGEEHSISKLMEESDEISEYMVRKAERIAISGASSLNDEDALSDMRDRLSSVLPYGRELYPFQYAGVRFVELSDGRAIIGDDMGIGKTIQALAYSALHRELWPVLVICPANVKYNWAKEIRAWLPDATVQVVEGRKHSFDRTDFTVVNYDLVSYVQDGLEKIGANLVIIDESHYLKNKGTKSKPVKRTVACMSVAEKAKSVLCLSGTAITNRPAELFTTLEMVKPSEYKDQYWPYVKRYCNAYHNGFAWDVKGSSNMDELHEKLRDIMIRRLKEEVLPELPDKVRQFIPAVPSESDLAKYKKSHRSWIRRYESYMQRGGTPKGFVLTMLTDLRHEAGKLKVSPTVDWLENYKSQNPDTPVVVFFHHRDVGQGVLNEMARRGNQKGYDKLNHKRWRVIDGNTPPIKREKYIEQFQMGAIDGLLCSTVAAKEGITLTAADTVLFIEREWVPGWEEQAEDRIRRIGAEGKDTVWAIYLSVVGTIDERFDRIVESKREVVTSILNGGDDYETRTNIGKELIKEMVEAGELPEEMLRINEASDN